MARPKLDNGILGARTEATVALEAVAARQASAGLDSAPARPTGRRSTSSKAATRSRVRARPAPGGGVAEVPEMQLVERRDVVLVSNGWLVRKVGGTAPQPLVDTAGGFLAMADTDGHSPSLGTMSPPANTPGQPVSKDVDTRTVPSDSNSTPGTWCRKEVSVSCPRARITVSAASVSKRLSAGESLNRRAP